MRRMACRVCVLSSVGALFAWEACAAGIATVTDVINEGYRKPPGATELPVAASDELVPEEALRTGEGSTIEVKFVDGSELSVEALSEVVLSDYVFDPAAAASTGLINLNVGLFRFSSADLPDSGIKLKTPVATIGIRGTQFLVTVTSSSTVVDIVDGAVEVAPVGSGKAITCEGGQSILVAGPDEDAICADFGAFSTAAGPPTEQASLAAKGEPRGGARGRPADGGRGPSGGGAPGGGGGDPGGGDPGGGDPGGGDPGGGDPGGGDPGGGPGNHSGLGDGTNPGKGHGNGNGNGNGNSNGGNGGANNPGGGRK